MDWRHVLLVMISVLPTLLALFPGAFPSEGEYRHLYPVTCIAVGLWNHTHTLPYVMGLIEDLRYPKDLTHVSFFMTPNSSRETKELAEKWCSGTRKLYRSAEVIETEREWHEAALVLGRSKSCDYLLITDGDTFLMRDSLQNLQRTKNVVSAPLISSPFDSSSNMEDLLDEDYALRKRIEKTRIYYTRGPFFIHLKHTDSSYLTFDADNIRQYDGSGHPIDIFAFSAYTMNVPIFAENAYFYGYFLDSAKYSASEHRKQLGYFLANLASDGGPMPFPHASVLEPWYPPASRFGFDKLYLVNLKRRPERLAKMRAIFGFLGIQFDVFEAVDGETLPMSELAKLKFIPEYQDPFYKRPMKKGEIGCFLSHHRIWEDVVKNQYERVLVFEDDVRFVQNGLSVLQETIEDIMKTRLAWDFIYLGRKKMSAHGDEFFVPGHRRLSTVGYSYWTLGYALSFTGAKKLVDTKPLDRLLALDEFLPIMYDKHPNKVWADYFYFRELQAYAIYPVVVVPERYTHEPGYVSDTENTSIVYPRAVNKSEVTVESTKENANDAIVLADIKRQEL